MGNYLKTIILSCALVLISSNLFAQLEPVQWTFEVEKVSDKEYDIIFKADIDRGWSVYSQFLESQQGPIPTSFEFETDAKIELVGKTKESGNKKETFDKTFGIKLVKFSNKARFTQRVKVDSMAKEVNGSLTYMTCDAESCLPPENVKFSIALKN